MGALRLEPAGEVGRHGDEALVDRPGQLLAGLMEEDQPEGGGQERGRQPEDQRQATSERAGLEHAVAPVVQALAAAQGMRR